MRSPLLLLMLFMAALGYSQFGLPNTPQVPSNQGGFLTPKKGQDTKQVQVLHASDWAVNGAHVEGHGDVQVIYKGYTLTAEDVVGDTRTEVFTLYNSARVEDGDTLIVADSITLDFKAKTYSYKFGEAKLPPSDLQNRTTGAVYVKADEGHGNAKKDNSEHSLVTTCDLDHPHFGFAALDSEVVANKYIKMHDVKVQLFGQTLFTLPYLYIPLQEDASRLIPEVGKTSDEGYFVKLTYFTPIKAEDLLIAHFDYMQLLGLGLGGDYKYASSQAAGTISYYTILGPARTVTANISDQRRIGKTQISVDGTYQGNNYLTDPNSTYLSFRGSASTDTNSGTYRFAFSEGQSTSDTYTSTNDNLQIGHQNQWSKTLMTQLDLNYSGNSSSSSGVSTTSSKRLDVHFNGTDDLPLFKIQLEYQRAVPIGDSSNFSPGNDITPQFTLQTDASRLWGSKTSSDRFGLKFQAGEVGDEAQGRYSRYDFESSSRYSTTRGNLSFYGGGRFIQGLYSDDTAQYVIAYDGRLAYNYQTQSSVGVAYSRQRQFGYTPLATDLSGRNDNFNLEWAHSPNPSTRITVATGYDVQQASNGGTPWQSVSINGQFTRNQDSRLQAAVQYDTFNQVWSSFRLDGTFKWLDSKWAAGVRYDGSRAQWAGFNLQVRGLKTGRVTFDGLWGYNGYTQQLEAQQYNVVYDLHCAEAVLSYTNSTVGFRPGPTLGLFIRIKALPFTDNFGIGTRGQNLFNSGGLNY